MDLYTWKPILTTVLLGLALAQELGQALMRGWLRFIRIPRHRLKQFRLLHRGGGIAATLLTLAILGMGLYAALAQGYRPFSARGTAHIVVGSLAVVVLLTKVVITHRLRRYLRLTTALGVVALLSILAVFLLLGLPGFFP